MEYENEHEKYRNISDKVKKYNRAKAMNREKLLSLKALPTNEDYAFIADFESKNKIDVEKNKKALQAYTKKVKEISTKPKTTSIKIKFEDLLALFLNLYARKKHPYILNTETEGNLNALLYYFSIDKRFLTSPRLITKLNFNGKIKELKPSSSKGLLIVGSFGVSKSTSMEVVRCLYYSLAINGGNVSKILFRSFNALQIVDTYESLTNNIERKKFNDSMCSGIVHFGDIKTESEASNYGKKNLIKDIFEKRYDKGLKTHADMNFKKGYEGNVEEAILELGEKYGDRFFDRVFSMFNIIVFTGKSYRGLY